jgi:hypothetical protein
LSNEEEVSRKGAKENKRRKAVVAFFAPSLGLCAFA